MACKYDKMDTRLWFVSSTERRMIFLYEKHMYLMICKPSKYFSLVYFDFSLSNIFYIVLPFPIDATNVIAVQCYYEVRLYNTVLSYPDSLEVNRLNLASTGIYMKTFYIKIE